MAGRSIEAFVQDRGPCRDQLDLRPGSVPRPPPRSPKSKGPCGDRAAGDPTSADGLSCHHSPMRRRTSSWSKRPAQAFRRAPSAANRMAAGWPRTPSSSHDWDEASQTIVKVMPVSVTKSEASSRFSWVPRPTTRRWPALSRANCSRAGDSDRQIGQLGAQNQSRSGLSAGSRLARPTASPVATSVTSTAGRELRAGASELAGAPLSTSGAPALVVLAPPQAARSKSEASRRDRCRVNPLLRHPMTVVVGWNAAHAALRQQGRASTLLLHRGLVSAGRRWYGPGLPMRESPAQWYWRVRNRTRGEAENRSHNPKVVGSNPTHATNENAVFARPPRLRGSLRRSRPLPGAYRPLPPTQRRPVRRYRPYGRRGVDRKRRRRLLAFRG